MRDAATGTRARLAVAAAAAILALACGPSGFSPPPDAPVAEWVDYGGDKRGLRYSALSDITPENVSGLEIAWVHHTGDVAESETGKFRTTSAYEEANGLSQPNQLRLVAPMYNSQLRVVTCAIARLSGRS